MGAAYRGDVTDRARAVVTRLAREAGEGAFFSARRGDETVCVPASIVDGSAAVFDRGGWPAWALLTGVETRFKPDRHPELGTMLLDAAHLLFGRIPA